MIRLMLIMLLLLMSCYAIPYYRVNPDGKGFEVFHPKLGEIHGRFGAFKTPIPDTIRTYDPNIITAFGESSGIVVELNRELKYPNPFGPKLCLMFYVLEPDSMIISLMCEDGQNEVVACRGYSEPGSVSLRFNLKEYIPECMNLVKITIGQETKYFKSGDRGFNQFDEVEYALSKDKHE